jgi:iron complex outermembrane receptor protein
MLVLIDGRSVYTPLFSGVFWDVQDVLLEDVERIEVIRGPGATLWGANAVNGVVNIITKRAEDTQGGLITGGFGNEEEGFGGVRYGGKIGANAHYRVYGKHFSRSESVDSLGNPEADSWNSSRGGTRVDWNLSPRDSLTVQGDVYRGRMNQTTRPYVFFPPTARKSSLRPPSAAAIF